MLNLARKDPALTEVVAVPLRAEIGADRFATAASTRKGGWLRALLARLVERLLPLALRLAGRKKQGPR